MKQYMLGVVTGLLLSGVGVVVAEEGYFDQWIDPFSQRYQQREIQELLRQQQFQQQVPQFHKPC